MSEDLDLERCLVYAGEAYSTFSRLRDNGEEQSPRCQALGMYFTALMKRVSLLKDDGAALARLDKKPRALDSVIEEGQAEGRQLEALHALRSQIFVDAKARMRLELGARSTSASSRSQVFGRSR